MYQGYIELDYPFIKWGRILKKNRLKLLLKIPGEFTKLLNGILIKKVCVTFEKDGTQKREIKGVYKGKEIIFTTMIYLPVSYHPYMHESPWRITINGKNSYLWIPFPEVKEELDYIKEILDELCPRYDADDFVKDGEMQNIDEWIFLQKEKEKNKLYLQKKKTRRYKKIKDM